MSARFSTDRTRCPSVLVRVLVLACVELSSNAYGSGPLLFDVSYLAYESTSGCTDVVAADFNSDGVLDLVTADYYPPTNRLSVFLGLGEGEFTTRREIPTMEGPVALVADDFDEDGLQDLAVACTGARAIEVFLGRGDGTLVHEAALGFPYYPGSLVSGDLNGDGHADLVGAMYSGARAFLGNGDGSFGSPAINVGIGSGAEALDLGDFDEDGTPDLAVVRSDGSNSSIELLFGVGDGTFDRVSHLPTEDYPSAAYADFDADGHLDIVVSDVRDCEPDGSCITWVVLHRGNGDGTFRTEFLPQFGFGVSFADDLTGDGVPDLVGGGSIRGVGVLVGHGDGTFDSARYSAAGPSPSGSDVGDFDSDGCADLAVADYLARGVSVLLGHGDGSFGNAIPTIPANPEDLVAEDLDDDSDIDLIAAERLTGPPPADGRLRVYLNDGSGGFEATPGNYPVFMATSAAASGDLDGDGRPDLVAVSEQATIISVFLNLGGAVFGDRIEVDAGQRSNDVAVADFDSDGDGDLCTVGLSLSIVMGRGNGQFGSPTLLPVTRWPRAIMTGDLDQDGDLDIVTANVDGYLSSDGSISVFLGNGDGTFAPRRDFATGQSTLSVSVGDVNHDGEVDLATADGGGSMSVLIGQGDGTFAPALLLPARRGTNAISIVDLDLDGHPDLAGTSSAAILSVYLGTGDGGFLARTDYGFGALGRSFQQGDWNRDGAVDLAVQSFTPAGGSGIGLLFNRTPVPTAIAMSLVSSEALHGENRLSWIVSSERPAAVTVFRCAEGEPWSSVADLVTDSDGRVSFVDTDVDGVARYGYRLGIERPPGWEYSAEVWLGTPEGGALAVRATDPVSDGERLLIMLPKVEPAVLEIFDASGRRVRERSLILPAGEHSIDLHERRRLTGGVYWARLRQGASSATAKVIVVP